MPRKTVANASGAAAGAANGKRPALPGNVRAIVWARAAGRCQFEGCNDTLIGDLVSGKPDINRAYIAHIVADKPLGRRGDTVLSPALSKDPTNLMLLCDTHHRVIDGVETWSAYPVERLRAMKQIHESRIATLTAVDIDRASHVIRFAAQIGQNESPVAKEHITVALVPERYPAEGGWIDLDVPDLGIPDSQPSYWVMHQSLLRQKFTEKVVGRRERGEIKRLQVCGLAPIPLLVELGRLISDITDAEVRQLLREPKGWAWANEDPALRLVVTGPVGTGSKVVLKLELSGEIEDGRITSVLGDDVSIWSVTAATTGNDIIRTATDLQVWRREVRSVLEAIKDRHGLAGGPVHVFPAIAVSAAVELGRVWMPKAHLPMRLYDQNRALKGFVPTLDIAHEQLEVSA